MKRANREKKSLGRRTNLNGERGGAAHPDHGGHLKRLNRVIGQLSGIKRMVEERRYCPDILLQMRAAASAIKSIELKILDTHLRHCVRAALKARGGRDGISKIEEIVKVVSNF